MNGYCSDITRMFHVGEPPSEVRRRVRRAARRRRKPRCAPRRSARRAKTSTPRRGAIITAAGFGDQFIHRTGHGIGREAHEDPYIVAGNAEPLAAGHAFSVEPGIYLRRPVRLAARGHRGRDRRRPRRLNTRRATSRVGRLIASLPNVKLDGATFLLQWATGGLLFLWVTTRRREVGLGYGWLLRGVYGVIAAGAVALFAHRGAHGRARHRARGLGRRRARGRGVALVVSVARRRGRCARRARS